MNYLLRRKGSGKETCEAISSFSKSGLKVIRNDKKIPAETSTIIRWGCTTPLPPLSIINSGVAINRVSDKTLFRQIVKGHSPHLIPGTWFDFKHVPSYVLEKGVITRPRRHQEAKHLYFCKGDYEKLEKDCHYCGEGYYISEFIPKVAEYRVSCIQGKVNWVARKFPDNPDDIAWNNAEGGHFHNVRWKEWPLDMIKTSLEVFNLSELDFGAVDTIIDSEGHSFVLEINTSMMITSEYRQKCMAACFDYMIKNGSEKLPITNDGKGYGAYLHPAIKLMNVEKVDDGLPEAN